MAFFGIYIGIYIDIGIYIYIHIYIGVYLSLHLNFISGSTQLKFFLNNFFLYWYFKFYRITFSYSRSSV